MCEIILAGSIDDDSVFRINNTSYINRDMTIEDIFTHVKYQFHRHLNTFILAKVILDEFNTINKEEWENYCIDHTLTLYHNMFNYSFDNFDKNICDAIAYRECISKNTPNISYRYIAKQFLGDQYFDYDDHIRATHDNATEADWLTAIELFTSF